MPWLVGNAGDGLLIRGIAQNEAIFPAVLGKPGVRLVAHQIHRQSQLMLAGAGDGYGFQCLVPSLPEVQIVGFHMFPGSVFQNGSLGPVGSVAGVDLVGNTGGSAVVQHLAKGRVAPLVHGVGVIDFPLVQGKVIGQRIQTVDQNHLNALGGEIVGFAVNLRGRHGHEPVFLEIIPVFAFLMPAYGEIAGIVEEPFSVLHVLPAGEHRPLGAEIPSTPFFLQPAGILLSVLTEVPKRTVNFRQAGGKKAIHKEVVVRTDLGKAVCRQTVGSEIAPLAIQFLPAGEKSSVLQIVPPFR